MTADLKELCASIDSQESHIPGSLARNCIISALHFDFQFAIAHSTFSLAHQKYREEALNIQVLSNILKNLVEMKATTGLSEGQARDKLQSMVAFTKGLQNQMKNPYLKAFFCFL